VPVTPMFTTRAPESEPVVPAPEPVVVKHVLTLDEIEVWVHAAIRGNGPGPVPEDRSARHTFIMEAPQIVLDLIAKIRKLQGNN